MSKEIGLLFIRYYNWKGVGGIMAIKVTRQQKNRFLGLVESDEDIRKRARRMARRALQIRKELGDNEFTKDVLMLNKARHLVTEK